MQVPNDQIMTRSLKASQLRLAHFTRVLPVRSDLHLSRKIWHALTGVTIIICYMSGMPQSMALTILGALFAWSLTMETLRLRNPAINEKCVKYFSALLRSHEVNKVSGMPYYLASSIVAIGVFPKPVAILSLFYLAFGDPVASLVGILYKERSVKIFNGTKSLHGTAGGFAVCALVTWFYLRSNGMYGLDLIRLSLLGGFAGALAELLPLDLDDNFTIPVISGFILWLGFIVIHFV